MGTLDFEPACAPAASLIGCLQRLRHQPFVARRDRRFVEGACGWRRGGYQSRDSQRLRNRLCEKPEALFGGRVGDGSLPKTQTVEEESADRQLVAQRVDVELAAKTPHGRLEWMRAPHRVECDGFAVEDQGSLRKR